MKPEDLDGTPCQQAYAKVAPNPQDWPTLLWTPSAERAEASNLTAFMRWPRSERGLRFADYDELWRWSVTTATLARDRGGSAGASS